ncbi:nuclear transport factor 2 family protein [Telluribacter humicola]|uniref:nuclear transport factor 2 family protein n=1 Tax=Telluribacter humicola TaxID=1720261 RepID=UPI001A95731E|nr:nuclear transport factor 2 family protein [Telluribacter humicola]
MNIQENITTQVLTHHLTAFGNNDLDEILKDYTEESEVLTPEGPLKGLAAIRKFFADFFVTIPTGSDFEMKRLIVTGNTAYIVWSSESAVANIPMGTDTFFLEGEKIRLHTVASHVLTR